MIFFPSQIIQLTYLHHIHTFASYSQPVLRLAVWFYMYFRPKDNLTRAYINTCTETLVLHYDVKFMYVICRFVSVYQFIMTKMNLLKISQKNIVSHTRGDTTIKFTSLYHLAKVKFKNIPKVEKNKPIFFLYKTCSGQLI